MIRSLLTLALLAAPVASNAQAPTISLDQRLLLRCSAAFAMVAHGQQSGQQAAQAYPDLSERGREYFVRASASVMEQAGLDREGISAVLRAEAQDMHERGTLDDVMRVCLPLLPPE